MSLCVQKQKNRYSLCEWNESGVIKLNEAGFEFVIDCADNLPSVLVGHGDLFMIASSNCCVSGCTVLVVVSITGADVGATYVAKLSNNVSDRSVPSELAEIDEPHSVLTLTVG